MIADNYFKTIYKIMLLSEAGTRCALYKSLAHVFSCEFCEIFNNNFFTEHLWTNASVLYITFEVGLTLIFKNIPVFIEFFSPCKPIT